MRKLIILVLILVIALIVFNAADKYGTSVLNILKNQPLALQSEKVKVVTEESVVIDAVKKVGPSVVTVSEEISLVASSSFFDFGPFSIFGIPDQNQQQTPQPQNIGSGFIVTSDGLVVTNKHVVSDIGGKYQIITSNDKKYDVQKIYRDPLNDIAILKIDPSQNPGADLKPITMGDSSRLQVGQFAIAIGTALGEFRNTVTTGVISGLGRGITAGDQFQGYVEKLDNVIQTNAAINPGNSGGPLLNSSAQVIGINTAVASNGQNIGFALPINVVKDSLDNFNKTGQFNRPYLGVTYKMISRDLAVMNNLPEGAYVQKVIANSPADKGGIKSTDIITKIDNQRIAGTTEISAVIAKKKVGDSSTITLWRDEKTIEVKVTFESAPNQ
ncbi:MAG: trypsin-like peptidase domain-containing protein [Candidatus Levyibacteriota bacterium]